MNIFVRYKLAVMMNDIWFKYINGIVAFLMACLAMHLNMIGLRDMAIRMCLAGLRFKFSSRSVVLLKKIMAHDENIICRMVSKGVSLNEAAGRTIVLKWPDVNEDVLKKGIILIKFTRTFSFYLNEVNIASLEKYFYVVLEPSWSGYADPDILAWITRARNIVVQSSELQDRVLLNCFPETFVPVSFGSGSWVPEENFSPDSNAVKEFDSIYIANNNPIKRVSRYLHAIKKVTEQDASYRACLVCASWGGGDAFITQLVKNLGLEKSIALYFSLSQKEVAQLVNRSKCNILLSFKEGSNRTLFESMFCNVPVICLSENIGVNKAHINEYTGLLVPDSQLESSLLWMAENSIRFSPRIWAQKNISPFITKKCLIDVINTRAGDEIDYKDVFEKINSPEAKYMEKPGFKTDLYMTDLINLFHKDAGAVDHSKVIMLSAKFKQDFLSADRVNH